MTMSYPGSTAPGAPRRWKRKHSLGCFGSLILLVVLGVLIQVLFTPWAFHIGGSFTPSMRWTGVAEGQAPDGSAYAMQIKLAANNVSQHACSSRGCDDFHGTASVCTAAGEFQLKNLLGQVGGWTSIDGQKMTLSIAQGTTNADQYLLLRLTGTWHGAVYQANDEGYLVRAFNPNGTLRAAVPVEQQSNAVALAFKPGDFAALCAKVKK